VVKTIIHGESSPKAPINMKVTRETYQKLCEKGVIVYAQIIYIYVYRVRRLLLLSQPLQPTWNFSGLAFLGLAFLKRSSVFSHELPYYSLLHEGCMISVKVGSENTRTVTQMSPPNENRTNTWRARRFSTSCMYCVRGTLLKP